MMYALNLSKDGRILSATFPQYAPDDAVIVDHLPEGDITNYRYVSGATTWAYVYDPLPEPEQPESPPSQDDRIDELEAENKKLTAQVNALSAQLDFQEECLVEMASIIYA